MLQFAIGTLGEGGAIAYVSLSLGRNFSNMALIQILLIPAGRQRGTLGPLYLLCLPQTPGNLHHTSFQAEVKVNPLQASPVVLPSSLSPSSSPSSLSSSPHLGVLLGGDRKTSLPWGLALGVLRVLPADGTVFVLLSGFCAFHTWARQGPQCSDPSAGTP